MVELDRDIDHIIIELLVPSEVEMQPVIDPDLAIVTLMVVITTPPPMGYIPRWKAL